MGWLWLAAGGLILAWLYGIGYRSGKREGSRKGYGVGLARGRRRRGQDGCLVLVVAGLVLLGLAAVLLAR
jgi:hypothetical protein